MSDKYEVLIRNGRVYDGSGSAPFVGDVAIREDRIAAVGSLTGRGQTEIDSTGLAVAPGFINMLSWANESLIEDGRSQSDIRQGVTLEVLGEGLSMGPLSDAMKKEAGERQGDIKYEICWTTLGEYLDYLAERGVSPNIASFVGATTVRTHVLGYKDCVPTPDELDGMCQLVRQAMEEGALGLSSALIYAPGCFAETEELMALAKVAAEYEGLYISHIRSEGSCLLDAVDELVKIAREAGVGAEIYHLKASGQANWGKLDRLIEEVETARASGLRITANMYTYAALSTGLDAAMPPWVQEDGLEAWVERLKNPGIRERVKLEMATPTDQWDNAYLAAGSPENIILVGFKSKALKPLIGKTLAEIASLRNASAEETAMHLVIEDHSGLDAVFFAMSEENVRKQIALRWVSFGSDGASMAPDGVFLRSSTHPRAYGTFARLLGRYVREEKVITLEEAIRRLTSLPACNLKLDRRGLLVPGYFADVVVFDPAAVQDHATFDRPHQYSTGIAHVFVNGQQVLKNGEHTNAKPGRIVRGSRRRQRQKSNFALVPGTVNSEYDRPTRKQ